MINKQNMTCSKTRVTCHKGHIYNTTDIGMKKKSWFKPIELNNVLQCAGRTHSTAFWETNHQETYPKARKPDWSRWACCLFGLKPSWGLHGSLFPLSQSPGFRTLLGILKEVNNTINDYNLQSQTFGQSLKMDWGEVENCPVVWWFQIWNPFYVETMDAEQYPQV